MATDAVPFAEEPAWQKRLRAFWSFLREELKPSPERYAGLFRLTAAVLIALWINMTFGLSDIGISLYMPFFFLDASLKKNAISLVLVLATCAVGLLYMVFVMNTLGGSPPVRFVASTFIVFFSMYMGQVAQLPQPWIVLAIFGGSYLRAWDEGFPAAYTITGSLRLFLSLLIGCSTMVLVQFVLNVKSPLHQLQDNLISSLETVHGTLAAHLDQRSPREHQAQLQKLALQGASASRMLLKNAGRRNQRVRLVHARLSGAIGAVTIVIDQALWFSLCCGSGLSTDDSDALETLGSQLRDLEQVIREGRPPAIFTYPQHRQLSIQVASLAETVQTLAAALSGDRALPEPHEEKPKSSGFLKPGALRDKDSLLSAFKTTLAATLCYGLYTGFDWPQIDTCVTTCIITTEKSQGMERQKQVLRLVGDSLGGLCAVGSIALIMPHLASIAGLTALVAVATLVGGYAVLGSYKLAYGGRQFAFAFFLATLTGTRTPNSVSLDEARDRVIGVMLGVFAMWAVYDQIKPVRTYSKMREAVFGALEALEKIRPLRYAPCSAEDKLKELAGLRSSFGSALQTLQMNTELRAFEVTLTQAVYKQRLPVLQQLIPLLLQFFLRGVTAVEADILDLETSKHQAAFSEESMRRLVDLSKTLLDSPVPPTSDKPVEDDVLLSQMRDVLQQALAS